jgi:DNA invertase Pin-like site-specific DNA recombinase
VFAYLRTSTLDQRHGLEAQRSKMLAVYPHAEIFEEHVSGKRLKNRPELTRAIEAACASKGILCVTKLDRLGRSARELHQTADRIKNCGATLHVLGMEPTNTPTGRMFFGMLATFAEFEREMISERTVAALETVRTKGTKLGGKRTPGQRADGSPTLDEDGNVKTPGKPGRPKLTPANDVRRSVIVDLLGSMSVAETVAHFNKHHAKDGVKPATRSFVYRIRQETES